MNLSVGANAVQVALTRADAAAGQVALGPTSSRFASDLVELKMAQRQVESAVEVLQTQNEILGYLIDELA